MVDLKMPRSCKNCQLSENGKCFLRYPVEKSEGFPYTPFPLQKCYKVVSNKDYMTIIRNIEVYRYRGFDV